MKYINFSIKFDFFYLLIHIKVIFLDLLIDFSIFQSTFRSKKYCIQSILVEFNLKEIEN